MFTYARARRPGLENDQAAPAHHTTTTTSFLLRCVPGVNKQTRAPSETPACLKTSSAPPPSSYPSSTPSDMAATADPRAKPPAAPSTHHLEPWARPQQPPRPHRVPAVESLSGAASGARDRRRSSSESHRRDAAGHDDDGIEGLRVKLMGHLRDAADRLRVPKKSPPLPPPPKAKDPEPERKAPPPPPPEQQQQPPQEDVAEKPWKLRERTRRRPAALSSSWPAAPPPPSRRRKRAPFSVPLSTDEIEEDIYELTGGRPRRRPRKRPRAVQRQLDTLFPGLWLAEVTADDYKVPDDE